MRIVQVQVVVAGLAVAAGMVSSASAELIEYYIGVDSRSDGFNAPSAEGGGTYPDNPNLNRLTFLYQHGNHFHPIGAYSYSGPAATPTLNATNSNNRIPEGYTLQPPLVLTPGSGAYAGKLASSVMPGVDYSDLEVRSIHSLDGFAAGSPEAVLRGSSTGRYAGSLDGSHIHVELVSITDGLSVGVGTQPGAMTTAGDDWHVGDNEELFSFTPVFWTDAGAVPGTYSAEFRLTDLAGAFGDSGSFFFDVAVPAAPVPEPGTLVLIAAAGMALVVGRQRRTA